MGWPDYNQNIVDKIADYFKQDITRIFQPLL